ncbi:MAG: cytosine permease [Gulosibacter sp.]|uniref:cytosine permease n=1 Tax=Gulosibacter sp. TaxID=2817531 RepID=UPI003F91345F
MMSASCNDCGPRAMFAVMAIDYYIARRGVYDRDILRHSGGKYWFTGGWNFGALLTWVIGGATYWLLAFVWPVPIGAALPTVVVSALVYWISIKVMNISVEPGTKSLHLADGRPSAE